MEVIVELGNTHEGSLGVAKSFVMMAKNAGAKVVKFQMHLAEFEGTALEPFRTRFSDQDSSRQDYWRRINFSFEHWENLAKYCQDNDVEFLCTPLSVEAANFLHSKSLVSRWKVGSGQATDWPLIDFLSGTKLPMIISTGLVSSEEISSLKARLVKNGSEGTTTLLHCVSKYPVKLEEIDLHLMPELSTGGFRYGYSDHSGLLYPSIYALTLGAEIVEVHMTPRKDYFGPDVSSSLTPEEIRFLIEYAEALTVMKGSKAHKDEHFERVSPLRKIFRKGIYWSKDLPANHIIRESDLRFLKPCEGIDVSEFEKLIGKRTMHPVNKLEAANWGDIGD